MSTDNLLLPHILIEFIYESKQNRKGVLLENSTSPEKRRLLLEKYGVFPDCERIADGVMSTIDKEHHDNDREVIKIDNCVFLKKICVFFKEGNSKMSYIPNFTKVDNDGNFEYAVLVVGIDRSYYEKSLLMHELQHVYEDWNLRRKGGSIDSSMKKSGYYNTARNVTDSEAMKMVKDLFYFLNKSELNAYITKMVQDLEDCDSYFFNVSDLFEYIRKQPIYKQYRRIFDLIGEFCNISNPKMKELILSYVNSIVGENKKFKTYRHFISWLRAKGIKTKKKIDDVIAKKIYEKYDKNVARTVSWNDEDLIGTKH